MAYDSGIHTIPGDVRAWGDRSRTHKMGWLRAGDKIFVENAYKNWRRFRPEEGCADLLPLTESYPQYFVNVLDIEAAAPEPGPEPGPEPEPEPTPVPVPSDALVGMAIRILANFVVYNIQRILK